MNARPPSLDDLICLNREIAALVRAGIPLEPALKGLSGGQGYRLRLLTDRLAERMSAGGSLAAAIAAEGPAVSPVYTAVIEAGMASGNLAQALESLAEAGQMFQETRRRIVLAAFYPLMCLALGYIIFLMFICSPGLPMFEEFFPQNSIVGYWKFLAEHSRYFTIVLPIVAVITAVLTFSLRNGLLRGVVAASDVVSLAGRSQSELVAVHRTAGAAGRTSGAVGSGDREGRKFNRRSSLAA